jgi:hypothetical protein
MPLLQQDMTKVAAAGDLVPEGWYHVRVKSVEVKDDEKNVQRVNIQMASQEEASVGRIIFDNPQPSHPMGLSVLKAYYKAVGYTPGQEGHDPEKLIDGEFYVYVKHNTDGDKTYANVAPWSIRSIQQGKGSTPAKK